MHVYGLNMHFSVGYYTASNVVFERAKGTLVTVFRKLCNSDHPLWVIRLEEAGFAVDSTCHRSSRFSPLELLFRFLPKLSHQKVRPLQVSDLSDRLLTLSD